MKFKNTLLLFAILGFIVLCSWKNREEPLLNKAAWLIGTWENKTSKGSIYETWSKVSSVEFLGKSYILQDNDTIVFETIQLTQKQDSLFYIPTVKNQNNNLPVRFSMKKISDTEMVFENQEHDFPQVISYTKITSDSLIAEISGTKNGQVRKQTFPMRRIK